MSEVTLNRPKIASILENGDEGPYTEVPSMARPSSTPPPYLRQCKRHSVFYNHEKFDSCAVCRGAATDPGLVISRIVIALFGALLVGAGLYLLSGPGVAALARVGDEAVARTESTIRLDPRAVSIEIAGVDDIMRRLAPESNISDAAEAVAVLADAVGNLEGPPRPLLARFKDELVQFSQRIGSDSVSAGPDTLRAEWERLRGSVFGRAGK